MDTTALVVVTGCSSGIGRALAQAFLARGCRVLATARRPERLAELAAAGALTAALDVADAASVAALAADLAARDERVAVLVNNAGFAAMGPAAALGLERLRRQFDTNVAGPIALAGALLPLFAPGALVANVGSVSGEFVTPWAGAYCASKAALHALGEALALELAPLGYRVLSVRPGSVRSDFSANAAVDAVLPIDAASPFAAYRAGVERRLGESQAGAASAEGLARRVVDACMRRRPPRLLRYGPKSRSLLAMRLLLPGWLLRRILSKRYGLA